MKWIYQFQQPIFMQTENMQADDTQINAATKREIFPSARIWTNKVHSGPFKLFHRDDIAFS